ncbi:MAG: 23S rRNA m(2)G2445 methyltransferase [Bacteroidetes bacterium ADurb.Bin217]|nr:MAG: 23S rRNA m(2)G2445 methyltransferase [Bacteroidetes bacterium ADurb.Bin217]
MIYFTPTHWKDYELLDSGNFEKLERFGTYVTIRPEPQAVWDKSMSESEWMHKATVRFQANSSNSGEWIQFKPCADSWRIQYHALQLTCNLKFTSFKHVGIFPEQAVNWDYMHAVCSSRPGLKVLNLFGYTGIASVAARAAGADVTHLDAIKQVVNWTRQNMEDSGLRDIRWIIEDARKFVAREIKRGNVYQGIIMDPPAFGRGTNGEDWKLERDINALLKDVQKILDTKQYFFILNTYSLGFSAMIIENLLHTIFSSYKAPKEVGELYLQDSFGKKLPLGVIGRFTNIPITKSSR